jgi:hypothetical protein
MKHKSNLEREKGMFMTHGTEWFCNLMISMEDNKTANVNCTVLHIAFFPAFFVYFVFAQNYTQYILFLLKAMLEGVVRVHSLYVVQDSCITK